MIFSPKLGQRYHELKAEVPDCLLVMQVGAFMDAMDEDRTDMKCPSYGTAPDQSG